MASEILHIVHCVDAEGPLYESVEATFDRLHRLFGIDLRPSTEALRKLQSKEIDLSGREDAVARIVSPALLNYKDTWDKIDSMLGDIMSADFRRSMVDSFGDGWIFNWHCVDHVGYGENPRRRDIGYHNVFDHYRQMIEETGSDGDGLHFHFHPMPFDRKAHHSATHWFAHSTTLFEILARRIIDRGWFPCVNRAGFHVCRPDSHWFLEQFIPFDLSNQATAEPGSEGGSSLGIENGRFGDWRRASRSWQPYHPAHDDYQRCGECRRWIARCLNVGTRHRLLRQEHVDQAFEEAAEGKPVVLALTNHDYRDMRPDIEAVRAMVQHAAVRYPEVKFRFSEAREAMRAALKLPSESPIRLDVGLADDVLTIRTDRGTFGPQPFLALKTKSAEYFHDNLDFQEPFCAWSYVFDEETFPVEALDKVGVGTCDATGNVTTAVLDLAAGRVETRYW